MAICHIYERLPHFARQLWGLVGDSVREVSAVGNVAEVNVGGADVLLFTVSNSIWMCEKKGGSFVLERGLWIPDSFHTDDDRLNSAAWNFFDAEVRKSTLGISVCGCTPPKANLKCGLENRQLAAARVNGALEKAEKLYDAFCANEPGGRILG